MLLGTYLAGIFYFHRVCCQDESVVIPHDAVFFLAFRLLPSRSERASPIWFESVSSLMKLAFKVDDALVMCTQAFRGAGLSKRTAAS